MDRKTFIGFLTLALALAGCSREKHITIGSKNLTEQSILGEIVAQHLEHRLGGTVLRRSGLGGTLLAQQALLANEIDVYPEYTGTALTNVLKRTTVGDPAGVLAEVRAGYAPLKLEWLDPLGFNNPFAMVVRGEDARARSLKTLSDAARDREGFVLGAGYEFLQRPDGYALLTASYPLKWTGTPKSMDLGLLYEALRQKQVSLVAASATDAVLAVMDAAVLLDDKGVFPPYQACLVVRSEALTSTPGLRAALNELSGKIATETMRKLNYEVDGKHRQAGEVAREFLRSAALNP